MRNQEILSEAIDKDYMDKIHLYQSSIISAIGTLIYSEFISKIKTQTFPRKIYLVPKINSIYELLSPDSLFMKKFSAEGLQKIVTNKLFKKYSNLDDLILFNDENINFLQLILDSYIIPNIYKTIPVVIRRKFNLGEENQVMIESNDIDLFDRNPISELQMDYIYEEIVLYLLMNISDIKKDKVSIDDSFILKNDEILEFPSSKNQSMIFSLYLNRNILDNKSIMNLISFVMNITVEYLSLDKAKIIGGLNMIKQIVELK